MLDGLRAESSESAPASASAGSSLNESDDRSLLDSVVVWAVREVVLVVVRVSELEASASSFTRLPMVESELDAVLSVLGVPLDVELDVEPGNVDVDELLELPVASEVVPDVLPGVVAVPGVGDELEPGELELVVPGAALDGLLLDSLLEDDESLRGSGVVPSASAVRHSPLER